MPNRGDTVLLDTTAIIEAHRVSIWKPLHTSFRLVTVEKCIEEVETGNFVGGKKVVIDTGEMAATTRILRVSDEQRAAALVASGFQLSSLDDGERELLAAASQGRFDEPWHLSSQDRACLRVGNILGMAHRFVSLEDLARVANASPRPALQDHFTEKWMSRIRIQCILGTL